MADVRSEKVELMGVMLGLEFEFEVGGGLGRSLDVVSLKLELRGDVDDSKERGGRVKCVVSIDDDDEVVRVAELCRRPSM